MKEFAYIHDEGNVPAALQAVPFLNSFSDEQLEDVLNSSSLLECEIGDSIIEEGTIDSRFYVLLSGQLEVRIGGKVVAAITRSGEVFGELALVNHDKRLASVVASSRSVCLAVDQKFLQDIHPREEDPAFHAALFEFVARLIAKKLDSTSRRLATVEKELRDLKQNAARTPLLKPVVKHKSPPTKPVAKTGSSTSKTLKPVARRPVNRAR